MSERRITCADVATWAIQSNESDVLTAIEANIKRSVGEAAWYNAVNDNSMSMLPGPGVTRYEDISLAA